MAKSHLTDLMIWFIGAPLYVTEHEKGQFRRVPIPKKKAHRASRREILKFIKNLKYRSPYKPPSKRSIYRWIEELTQEGYIETVNQIQTKGRPKDIFTLTDKGKEFRHLVDKKFEAHATLKGPSSILFSLDPEGHWMTAHVMIRDTEIIRIIKQELAKLNRERGRPREDLFFKGHPAFKYVGAMVFNLIMVLLRMQGQKVSRETEANILKIMNSLPAVFYHNRQDFADDARSKGHVQT